MAVMAWITLTVAVASAVSVVHAKETPINLCNKTPEKGKLFSSENFPENYEDNANCDYSMEATDPNNRVSLTFHLFDTEEENQRCHYDRATIIDTNGTEINKFCGKSTSAWTIMSTGRSLTMNFKTDHSVTKTGFLASWSEVSGSSKEESEGNYIASFSHTWIESLEEKVCVALFGDKAARSEGNLTLNVFVKQNLLSGNPLITKNLYILPSESEKCFNINFPSGYNTSKAIINFKGKFNSSKQNFDVYKEVNILGKETYNLIQTEKGQYKAKDVVKFRIMLVDHNLKPSAIQRVDEIWVEDARNRRIRQWKDKPLDRGMAQLEFTLPEEPTMGDWSIKVKVADLKEEAQFKVTEYVLPKFEVEIEPPAAVLRDATSAIWKVCGTYTHGGSVKGVVRYNFSSTSSHDAPPRFIASVAQMNSSEFCVNLELNGDQIKELTVDNSNVDNLQFSSLRLSFKLVVELEEAGTSAIQKAEWSGNLVNEAFKLDYSSSPDKFILGGFPYIGKLKATHYDESPVTNEPMNICVTLSRDISDATWNEILSMDKDDILDAIEKVKKRATYSSKCHMVNTDVNGFVKFYVPLPNMPKDVIKLSIKAEATNYMDDEKTGMQQPAKKLDVALTHQKSDATYVSIQDDVTGKIPCYEPFTAKVFFSSLKHAKFDIQYYAVAKGILFKSRNLKENVSDADSMSAMVADAQELKANDEDVSSEKTDREVIHRDINLYIDHRVSPSFKLVVLTRDGNTALTDSRTYNVEACQKHDVTVSWSKGNINPGDRVKFSVNAGAGSRCGVSVTDKSVNLLGNKNEMTKVKVSQLLEDISLRKINDECRTYEGFKSTGIDILTDMDLTNTCGTLRDAINDEINKDVIGLELDGIGPGVAYLAMENVAMASYTTNDDDDVGSNNGDTDGNGKQISLVSKPKLKLRNHFPESWLFELVDIQGNGEFSRDMYSPHTITEWQGEAVCINLEDGLGVASSQPLLVTQDFFAQLSLPYSVKRGEGFPLNISVFNYIDKELPIRVSFKNNDDEITTKTHTTDVCVSAKNSKVISINAKAAKLGNINITVEARITNNISNCQNVEGGEGYTDTLVKPLRVKPEGFAVEKVESEFKCLESSGEVFRMSPLTLPSNAVPDSSRAWVSVTGDIMAPALQNIGDLVNLPTGCGEQNMIGLVPNIFLLQYLHATQQKEPELEMKAKEYMQIGYDRQQNYKHPSGGYSIWGPKDKNASTWLTAFVVKSFSEASQFIEVDKTDLGESVSFLLSLQDENGCFKSSGYVYSSSLKGGSSDESLTPFVVIALLEAADIIKIKIDKEKIDNAITCMVNSLNKTDIYNSVLTTYAANLAVSKYNDQGKPLGPKLMKDIEDLWPVVKASANRSIPGDLFWDKTETVDHGWRSYSRSKAVEMTAYNVLTMTLLDQMPEAVDAVKWLAGQRNSKGGFISTQDTVVALQALSKYAQKVTSDSLNMTIDVVEKHENNTKLKTFHMNLENSLLLQTQKLTSLPSKLSLTAKGQGCAMVQTVLRYNMPEVEDNQGFSLSVENVGDEKLKVCSSYTGDRDKTGMVVLELELVTGWEPQSLDYLSNTVDHFVKRLEIDEEENKVVLYFDEMPKEEKCVEVPVKFVTLVEDAKDAIATIYDYYQKEDTVSIKYNMEN